MTSTLIAESERRPAVDAPRALVLLAHVRIVDALVPRIEDRRREHPERHDHSHDVIRITKEQVEGREQVTEPHREQELQRDEERDRLV